MNENQAFTYETGIIKFKNYEKQLPIPFNLKILSRANSLIVNKNIRSVILEIKNDSCKIVKILIFRSLSEKIFKVIY